jgi:hypothetical protein
MKLGLISDEWLEEMMPRLVQEGIMRYKSEKKEENEPQSVKDERKAFLAEKEEENLIIRGRDASSKKRMRDVEKREAALQLQVREFQEKEITLKRRKKIQKDREEKFEHFLIAKGSNIEEIDKIVLPEEVVDDKEVNKEVDEEEDVLTVPLADSPPSPPPTRKNDYDDSDECSLSFAQ